MSKLLKLMCLVLALVLVMGVMAACDDTAEEPTQEPTAAQTTQETVEQTAETVEDWANEPVSRPGELPIVEEPITLTAYAELTSSEDFDWNENAFLKWLAETTNVTIEITSYGAEDPKTKRNILLNSGSYPDLFLTRYGSRFNPDEITKYGQQEGILINILPYIDKYSYYLKAEMEKQPEYFAGSYALDGNLYGFPIVRQEAGNYVNPQAWVNQDWLDALDMDRPVTVDDFVEMLRAFKEQDPGGVGSENVLPWTSNTTCRAGAFVLLAYTECDFTAKTFLRTGNGYIEFAASTDEFREGLKLMNQLYDEGLFDPNSFTASWDAGIAASSSGLVGVYENQHILCMDYEDPETYRKLQVLTPLVGPEGAQNAGGVNKYYYCGVFFSAITDACEHPEAAVRLLDIFYSEEGTLRKEYGEPGVKWDYNDDPSILDYNGDTRIIKNYSQGDTPDEIWNNSLFEPGSFNLNEDFYYRIGNGTLLDTCLTDNSQPGVEQVRWFAEGAANIEYKYEGLLPFYFMDPESSEALLTIKPNIQSCVMSAYSEFIIGIRDPNSDDDWQAYLDELDGYGVDDYVAYYQEAYGLWKERMSSALGLE